MDRLSTVLDEAQNPPPEGAADGTIPAKEWQALADLRLAAEAYEKAIIAAREALWPGYEKERAMRSGY
jgi:hypothetical protein